jgi:hypothetical protein
MIGSVKSVHFKKALRVSRYTPSRLAYVLIRESLIDNLQFKLFLAIHQWGQLINNTKTKNETWFGFYSTEAVINRECMASITRFSSGYTIPQIKMMAKAV